jgi:hypothetical protein
MTGYCDFGKERHTASNVTCISCQKQDVACPFGASVTEVSVVVPVAGQAEKKAAKQPNKTEAAYGRLLRLEFSGADVRYEAMSLILNLDGERFRYSPDWSVFLPDGGILCVEVKNAGFKHASYGRSKLAFASARVQWPMFSFRWASLDSGTWRVDNF